MGIYNSAVITNTGQALLAQSVAGNDLKFTTVKTSNYTYPSGTSLANLTTLTGIKQSKNITGATVYNSRVIKISAMVDNAGVAAEYSINTIGVYATIGTAAEQLFAVITAQEADNMPAFNSRPYSYIYDMNMTMQGTANITVTVNNAGFVNINDLNNALDGVNDSITDLDETVNDRIDTLSSSVDTRINALNDALAERLSNVTVRSIANGVGGISWSANFKFAIVVLHFGKNTAMRFQFFITPDMLEASEKYMLNGAYKSSTDAHYVRVSYTNTYVKLVEWYWRDASVTEACPMYVYEFF